MLQGLRNINREPNEIYTFKARQQRQRKLDFETKAFLKKKERKENTDNFQVFSLPYFKRSNRNQTGDGRQQQQQLQT